MNMEERPLSIKRPRPAADENVDPIDLGAVTEKLAEKPVVRTPPVESAQKRAVGRPRKEPTFPLSNRVSREIDEILREASGPEFAGSTRAALEEAIKAYWGPKIKG